MTKPLKLIEHLLFILIITSMFMFITGSFNDSNATMYKKPVAVQTNQIESNTDYRDEYYKIRTPLDEKSTIYVEGKTKIDTKRFCIRLSKHKATGSAKYPITVFVTPDSNGEFSIKINTAKGNSKTPEVIDGKGTVVQKDESYGTTPGYNSVGTMTAGTYHLTIARATTAKDANVSPGTKWFDGALGGGDGYAYKEALLTIKSGSTNYNNPKLIKYNDAMSNNTRIQNLYEPTANTIDTYDGSYVRYQDTYLKDFSFVLTNPKTRKVEYLTSSQVSYLKKVADKVTAGAVDDYEKLLKIYEYLTENIYYDRLAYEQAKYQYANPYKNLYYLNNNVKSANSANGKVATTCQGYASMVIALARAEGIPARLVYGHHISQPLTIWADKKDSEISKKTHYWAEAYVDGRWIVIDANSGTSNIWKRSSFSSAGTWTHYGTTNYAHFDPSKEQMSASFSYNNINKGSGDGKYIVRKHEVSQLKSFLNTKSSGITNGKRLNKKYSSNDYSTWGTGASENFTTNGYGRVSKISWGKKNLYGSLNLSNFTGLKYLTVYSNRLTKLNLKGCSAITYVSASYNKLTSFDSTASSKTTFINLKGNKLTMAKFKHGKRSVTVQRNIKAGSFGMAYNKANSKKLTIYANKVRGYKYLGIYSSSGKKLTSRTTYSFNPTSSKYYVKYKKL